MMRKMMGVLIGMGLIGCGSGSDPSGIAPTQSTEDALSSSAAFECELHYYDAASLPNPHIFVAAKGNATVGSLGHAPVVLASTDSIYGTAQVFTRGTLTVQVFSGSQYLASGAYRLSTSKEFVTDLQLPMSPITKDDGITYDRLWIGCFPQK